MEGAALFHRGGELPFVLHIVALDGDDGGFAHSFCGGVVGFVLDREEGGFAHVFCGGVVGFVLDREEGLLLEGVVFGVFHGHLCSSSKTLFNSLRASFEALSLKLRWAR